MAARTIIRRFRRVSLMFRFIVGPRKRRSPRQWKDKQEGKAWMWNKSDSLGGMDGAFSLPRGQASKCAYRVTVDRSGHKHCFNEVLLAYRSYRINPKIYYIIVANYSQKILICQNKFEEIRTQNIIKFY